MNKLIFFLSFLFVLSCRVSNDADLAIAKWTDQASKVTIIRDQYGVPHIYGKTDADVVFGLMYAQCEDDFNRVEVNYINAMGRMAEATGEDDIYLDLRMKMYIDSNELKKEFAESPEWMQKLMMAFADGVNYFLYTHPDVQPRVIRKWEPWMALSFTEGSIGGDIERISTRDLANFYGEGEQGVIEEIVPEEEREPSGSNGISIAPSISATGHALFLINPHTSFFFRSEVHMVSEEGLNAYGAVTWGQFFVYQGFNEKCGWMHTSSQADAIDYYAETVRKNNGVLEYKHGETWKPITVKKIDIPYLEDGMMKVKPIEAYFTHHGPVIREENGKWITISLMVEHIKALEQSYMRTKAGGYDDFKKTMDLNTNSSNNTVYADADGNIAYFHGNFIPVRNDGYDWAGIVDGSNPDTDWKGLHSVDEMLHILNPSIGWIQNCNSDPFTASGPDSPKKGDYKTYMAPDAENYRGLHAVRVLEGKKDWTLDELQAAAYDSYLTGFAEQIPPLIKSYEVLKRKDKDLSVKVAPAIEMLSGWDYRYAFDSEATSLAMYWGLEFMRQSRDIERTEGESIYNYMANRATDQERVAALGKAMDALTDDFGSWKTVWGEINRFQRINGDISQPFNDDAPSLPVDFASGRWGSLASFGARAYPNTKKWYGTSGNSFVALVEFGEKIKARSILAGGISNDPESPHFDDQAEMYSKGIFKEVAFYRADVEAQALKTYNPGKE